MDKRKELLTEIGDAINQIAQLEKENKIMRKALKQITEDQLLAWTNADAGEVLSVKILQYQLIAENALKELIDHE